MAKLDLTLSDSAGRPLNIDLSASPLAAANLAAFEVASLTLAEDTLAAVLNQPISSLPADTLKVAFTASDLLKWKFDFGVSSALNVTFDPAFSASVEIRRKGEIFQPAGTTKFEDDLPLPPVAPTVDPGAACISIRLTVTLDASGQFAYTHGIFGFKVAAATGQRFLLAYHHKVSAATAVLTALAAAFRNFVLPYSGAEAARLQQGCFSEWEYLGKVNVNFAATVGFGGALLGARTAAELSRSLKDPNIGSLAIGIRPEFKVGAEFTVGYTHEDAFRTVLAAPAPGHVQLFLYKMNRNDLMIGLNLAASARLNASVQLEDRLSQVTAVAVEKLLPANLQNRAALAQALEAMAANHLDPVTKDLEGKINSFLANLDKLSATASLSFEQLDEHQALLIYTFDTALAPPAAFNTALAGNLVAQPAAGVDLAPGSFVRDTVTRRSTLRLQLFGVLEARSLDEYIKFGEMVYDGDGVLRLRYTRGRNVETNFFGHRKQVEIFFTATARSFADGQVRDADVRLLFILADINNAAAARLTASTLQLILGTSDMALPRHMREAIEANPAITTRLICSFAPTVFRALTFTAPEPSGRPQKLPHVSDKANYEAFASAFGSLHPEFLQGEGFPNLADHWEDWAQFNIALNHGPDLPLTANSRPDRRRAGNPGLPEFSNWPQVGRLSGIHGDKRNLIFVALEADRHFMNACEDLFKLATDLDQTTSAETLNELLQDIDGLAKGELSGSFPLFFGKPVLAALIARMNPQTIKTAGPLDANPVSGEFAVRLEIA